MYMDIIDKTVYKECDFILKYMWKSH